MARPKRVAPPRSPKAGRPPEEPASPPRVRRRRKTAGTALAKGDVILQTDRGPRALDAPKARGPKAKKR